MRFFATIFVAFRALRRNKMRSILTALGIIIGVMSVIAVVSLLQGFSVALSANFKGMGANTVFVTSYLSRNDQLAGKTAKITADDLLAIQHEVPGISRITPVLIMAFLNGQVQYQGQTTYSVIAGTTYTHAENTEFYPVEGRYLTLVNSALITLPGDGSPEGIAISGSDLFVTDNIGESGGYISEYTTSGATVTSCVIVSSA